MNIVNVGDLAECPECRRMGRVVWVSENKETVGIQCRANHRIPSRPDSRYGTVARTPSKTGRNRVFIMDIK